MSGVLLFVIKNFHYGIQDAQRIRSVHWRMMDSTEGDAMQEGLRL